MHFPRASGILLHPTSLPGPYGIGDMGPEAYRFVDFLSQSRQHWWQMLPLGPVGAQFSPYQALSSFAGNPLLISLDRLIDDGLLSREEAAPEKESAGARTDYELAAQHKMPRLKQAADRFLDGTASELREEYERFCREKDAWLPDFTLFMALRERYNDAGWMHWPDKALVRREADALQQARQKLARRVERHAVIQFFFFRQWNALRHYARERQVRMMGDVPIYVAHDSADVWAAPQFFSVNEDGHVTEQSGVPPDYFSQTGQLWGNPTYRWDKLQDDGFAWWIQRIRATLEMVDALRIDHFRGLEAYWAVPAEEETAMNGQWRPAPGDAFFEAIRQALGELPFIAEDLGVITDEVHALRERWGLPAMKVLQFAFCDGADHYRPHNYERNAVVYTGTHDTDTTRGWYRAVSPEYGHHDPQTIVRERNRARLYTGVEADDITWGVIRIALMSVAHTAIIPMQDILDLDSDARMNRPGIAEGQWSWRVTARQMEGAPEKRLRELTEVYGRA